MVVPLRDRQIGRDLSRCSHQTIRRSHDCDLARGARRSRSPATVCCRAELVVAEVGAAGALHDVAADRRHVSELTGRRKQQRFGTTATSANFHFRRHVAHMCERTNPQAAIRQRVDARHVGQVIYVQETVWERLLDLLLGRSGRRRRR